MTDQHRATPEQWALIAGDAIEDCDLHCLCLLELRSRVEALEAAQRPNPAAAPAKSGSLVENVALEIAEGRLWDVVLDEVARATIHTVAAWMQERSCTIANGSQWADMLRNEADG
jgi:hypothetical protein